MEKLYKSKIGDLKTKSEWLEWVNDFYLDVKVDKLPANIWERVQKVLKLEEVEGEPQIKKRQESHTFGKSLYTDSYTQYPEMNSNLQRVEWFEE